MIAAIWLVSKVPGIGTSILPHTSYTNIIKGMVDSTVWRQGQRKYWRLALGLASHSLGRSWAQRLRQRHVGWNNDV